MLAERVHVVEMNAGDIMHKWRKRKEKGKLQLGIFGKRQGNTQRPYDCYANTSVTVRRLSRLCEGIATVRD